MRARLAAVLTIAGFASGLWGCSEDPAPEVVESDLDLTVCLGAIDDLMDSDAANASVASTCRAELDTTVASGLVNTCLLVRETAEDAVTQRVGYHWEDGRLRVAFPDRTVAIPPGRALEAALFFLTESDETGDICETFELDTDCRQDGRCALKLIEDEVTPSAQGNTRITFTRDNGQCDAQPGTDFAGGGVETCDGMDNDCDTLVDEAVPGTGEPCEDGVGACHVTGRTVCDAEARMIVCNVVAPPAGDELSACRDRLDEGCCNTIDEDCDGRADELLACAPCTGDADCEDNLAGARCVEGRCEVCDPAGHGGCEDNQLCCGTTPDVFACQITGFGPGEDEQCGACGAPCVVVRDDERIQNADACTDRTCSCGTGPACGEPAPFCVAGQCIECIDNGDCESSELCCDGVCQPTSPEGQCNECNQPCNLEIANRCVDRQCLCGNNPQCLGERATCIRSAACNEDPASPSCDGRTAVCEECETDLDCPDRDFAACVDRQCRECIADDDGYCENAPAANAEGRRQCVGSGCFECDPRVREGSPDALAEYGCPEDGDSPICNPDGNTCRACQGDAECNTRPGDRNQCVAGRCVICDPADYAGCGDALAPVCDAVSFDCRPCDDTPECGVISPPGAEPKQCVNGQCTGCEPGTNASCLPLSAAPVCERNGDVFVCRGCISDDECPSHPGSQDDPDGPGPLAPAAERAYCFLRECRQCRPADHEGCVETDARPICDAGDCVPCARDLDCAARPGGLDQCIAAGAAAGQCKLCDPVDNAGCDDPQNPVCRPDFTCAPCADDAQCNRGRDPALAPLECVEGRCAQCDPRPGEENVGCDPFGDLPICDAVGRTCRLCASAAECVALDTERGLDEDRFGCVNGRCTECDPVTHVGCPETAYCDATGSCRRCAEDGGQNVAGDAQCQGRGDGRSQCVGGECHVCDPGDFAGCDPRSATPACNAATRTCEGCDADRDCRALDGHPANPVGPECVAGSCRACDPTAGQRSAGCVAASAAPFCDSTQFVCVACGTGVVGQDSRCVDNRDGLTQCIGDRCAECDPRNHDGCGEADAEPICDLGAATCRTCANSSECNARPGGLDQCVGGTCKLCQPNSTTGCVDPARPICNAEGTACVPCQNDDQCPGADLCVDGRCRLCQPGPQNRGCDGTGPLPYCDPATFLCQSCLVGGVATDARCLDPTRPQCDDGFCRQCDPANHDGCLEASAAPICAANGTCRICQSDSDCQSRPGRLDYCDEGRCVACDRDTDAGCDGASPICDNDTRTCRVCTDDNECPGDQQCLQGRCVGCDPATDEPCIAASTAPVCDATEICRACANDAECADNPDNGGQCIASGACTQCDPDTQDGCVETDPNPYCANNGACRPCANDAECVSARGARNECVTTAGATRCELCDPAGNAGCNAASTTPVCGGAVGNRACRGCQNDGECGAGLQCITAGAQRGACRACDPANNDGCDANSATPVCDAATFRCVGCTNDTQCAGRGDGRLQCVSGRCERCDPGDATDAGGCLEASETPICDPSTRTCVACANDAQCFLRGGGRDVCVAPNCRLCDPTDDDGCGGVTPICDDGTACRPCRNAAECGPGVQCLADGSCAGCNPDTNSGCDRDDPICDRGLRACRPCRDDTECGDGYCFEGRCEACDPEGHAECPANQLCCQGGAAQPYACQGTDPDTQCAACGVACDADGDPTTDGSNACVNRTCRCGNGIECDDPQPYCLGATPQGVCSECRADADCDPLSTAPICGDDIAGNDTNTCRACQSDAECPAAAGRGQCILTDGSAREGACHACDPVDHAGCDAAGNRPICDPATFTCVPCANDAACGAHPGNGGQCLASGACVECDGRADGCVAASNEPVCVAGNVCGCAVDADCNGNPNGTQCVAADGGGRICAQCDPTQGNAGCDLASAAPWCDPTTLTCVGCAGQNGRCAGNPGRPYCSANTCVECLTANHTGCGADQLCCLAGGTPDCVGVQLNQCTACGAAGACNLDLADTCDARGCVCGDTGGPCAPDRLCVGGACVECADDGDCAGGEFCVAGACEVCRPGSNDGCNPVSATPICRAQAGILACRGCQDGAAGNGECRADADLGDYCFQGRCGACDINDHTTCNTGAPNETRLCCITPGQPAACVDPAADPADDRCDGCVVGANECDAGQVCQNRACVPQ